MFGVDIVLRETFWIGRSFLDIGGNSRGRLGIGCTETRMGGTEIGMLWAWSMGP